MDAGAPCPVFGLYGACMQSIVLPLQMKRSLPMIIYHFDVFSAFVAKQHATFKRNDVISVLFVLHGSAAALIR